jgi:uncharacterized protein (TIGR00297 family)
MHPNLFVTPPFWLALIVAALLAGVCRAAKLLSNSGAVATFVVGTIIFGLGGGKFAVPLLTFFFTSSLLSRFGRARKAAAAGHAAKGEVRDAGQVIANGGVACIVVLIFAATVRVWPAFVTRNLLLYYLAALATVNADTWATELGSLYGGPPRLLSNWKPAPPGTSGAVTLVGMLAAFAGSLVVALSSVYFWRLDLVELLCVTWAGLVGCFTDSLLGAGLQAQYRDPVTGDLTERTEVNGRPNSRVRGLAFINNDVVNFLASAAGILAAWLLLRFGAGPYR